MVNQLQHLYAKCKALLNLESRLSAQEVELNQWQLFANHNGLQYIVGRGGANTCFYKIGEAERKVCYPQELLDFLKQRASDKFVSYSIYTKDKKLVKRNILSLDDALATKPKYAGMWLVGVTPTGKKRLYFSVAGLKANEWQRYTDKR